MPAIPIRNIYYLFLYAWARFPEGQQVEAGTEDSPDLPNLLARVLANGVRRLLRRGIHRDYVTSIEELRAPRGRLLLTPSISNGALLRHRLVCDYDELSPDVLPNRILKTTLRRLAGHSEIEQPIANELRGLARQLGPVDEVRMSSRLFRTAQLPRNAGHYDLLLRICEMAFEVMQPDQHGTESTFAALLENEQRMSTIFEQFVRNFLALHRTDYHVSAENIAWDVPELDELHAQYLPRMRTDVFLRSDDETVIVDAKFYKETFVAYRGGHARVRSGHLYQMLTYIEHARRSGLKHLSTRGILLYPAIDGQEIQLQYILGGSQVDVRTINLERHWKEVHQQMLNLVIPQASAMSSSSM